MPDPSAPPPVVSIALHLMSGTLYATPNAGNLRVVEGTMITWIANFPFTVEFAALTGAYNLAANVPPCGPSPVGHTYTLTLPAEPPASDVAAPSYKYTIKGVPPGEAAGKVLDPIIIVDKRPKA